MLRFSNVELNTFCSTAPQWRTSNSPRFSKQSFTRLDREPFASNVRGSHSPGMWVHHDRALHLGVRPQGYLRISKDMKGYGRIWKDIFWDLGYDWDHILKKISNQDILKYPDISHDILEYILARYPNSYPSDLSLNILIYPKEISTTISLTISTNDIQMISYYILIYPILISLWDIFHVILFIYPIISLLSLFYILLNILNDIQLWYPLHLQTYPYGLSIQDILLIYPLNYPIKKIG